MAEQRQFRFRLPWQSAVTAPIPEPKAPPLKTTEILAPARPTTTISIQQPPFKSLGIAPPSPSVAPETPAVVGLPPTQRAASPPLTTIPQPNSYVRTQQPGTAPPSPTRPSSPPPPTTIPQQKSHIKTQQPGTALPSPTLLPDTESKVAPPPIPDTLTKLQSFVPVEGQKLSEPGSKDDIVSPKLENRTQSQQKPSFVSENLKSKSTNGAPTPFSRDPQGEIKREEEIVTEGNTISSVSEEDNLRNRVAALVSSVAKKQANELSHKEEISVTKNPSKGIGSSDDKFMASSSHLRRKAWSESHNKAATSSNGREHVPSHIEIKEDIFKLIQKLIQGHIKSQIGKQLASVITLSGKNRGATMNFSGEPERKDVSLRNPNESTNDSEGVKKRMMTWNEFTTKDDDGDEEHRPTMAYINNNTQSINNSILLESVVNGIDPGVQLSLSYYQSNFESWTADNEPCAQRAEFNLTPANKLTHEPPVRTRYLRGLFLETNHCDKDNPDKSQIHGCKDRDIEIL